MPLGTLASASQESDFRGIESEFTDTDFPSGIPLPHQTPDSQEAYTEAPAPAGAPTAATAVPPVPPSAVPMQALPPITQRSDDPRCLKDTVQPTKWLCFASLTSTSCRRLVA